ncbi:hypothetical protein BGZ73_007509 [Actinomortierella ambigua]|nr:hypothetical protein BGZ73_007509 [Actinomortierella ambigua]
MDFLTKGYNALRGEKGQHQTGAETIDRICNRIEHGTLLEDRRAGVLALKGLAREYKRDIGSRGITVLCNVLHQDSMDTEVCKAILETLNILCQSDPNQPAEEDFGVEMSEKLLEESKHVAILLDILEETDFYVRFHIVTLLSTLVLNNTGRLQECILTAPMGISRLMDLLDDRREIIRNEGLLLLISLTETNADLQKIVAFENAFERLLAIIDDEGAISGGIIVQDCLQLVQNLLRYNVSNQNYFRETSCIQRIPALFNEDPVDVNVQQDPHAREWSDQKGNNMIMKAMQQCGIVQLLIDLSLTSNAPQRVKASAFYALAEVIRGSKINQDMFAKSVITPANPPPVVDESSPTNLSPTARSSAPTNRSSFQSGRGSAQGHRNLRPSTRDPCPALVEVTAIIVGRYPGYNYSIRAAATCLFQCYLLENIDAQMVLATTLTPPPENNPNAVGEEAQSPGTLLLSALQGWQEDEANAIDPYNSWFACVLLSHILQNNSKAKSIALALSFGDEEHGEDPVSLIHSIMASLMMAVKDHADVRVPLGYLALLCIWCYDSSRSVKDLLSESAHLQFLIELINPSSKDDIMIQGLAAFLLAICYEFNWEPDALITRATIQPIIQSRIGLDHIGACMNRVRESKHFKSVTPFMMVLPTSQEDGGKPGYQGQTLPSLYFDYSFVEFFKRTNEQSVKAMSMAPNSARPVRMEDRINGAETESKMASYKATIARQEQDLADLQRKLEEAQRLLMQQAQEKQAQDAAFAALQAELADRKSRHEALEKEHEDLLICLAEQDVEMNQLKEQLRGLGLISQ